MQHEHPGTWAGEGEDTTEDSKGVSFGASGTSYPPFSELKYKRPFTDPIDIGSNVQVALEDTNKSIRSIPSLTAPSESSVNATDSQTFVSAKSSETRSASGESEISDPEIVVSDPGSPSSNSQAFLSAKRGETRSARGENEIDPGTQLPDPGSRSSNPQAVFSGQSGRTGDTTRGNGIGVPVSELSVACVQQLQAGGPPESKEAGVEGWIGRIEFGVDQWSVGETPKDILKILLPEDNTSESFLPE